MTPKKLEELGILTEKTRLNPNRYWSNTTQSYMNITKDHTIDDVLNMIYESGYNQGIETGKAQRSQDIMNLLNNHQG